MHQSPTVVAAAASQKMLLIINLDARTDRRAFMDRSCVAPLRAIKADVAYVQAVAASEAASAQSLSSFALDESKLEALLDAWHSSGCEAVARSGLERYYLRPVSNEEKACTRSHRLAWQRAQEAMRDNADLKWVLIVEDDCVPCLHPAAESQWAAFYGPAWQVAWRHIAKAMESCGEDFDFVYVGRHRLGPEDESDAVVRPAGFSSCLHAYCVTRQGCDRLLEKSADVPLVPADDLVPALCGTHPRKDLLSTKEPLRAGCLQRDVLFQLQSIALPGDDVYAISHSSIEPPEMRSMRQELWRHPSLWLERKDILTLRCCGKEPLNSLNDASAWRRVVLVCVKSNFGRPLLDAMLFPTAASARWRGVHEGPRNVS